MLIKIRYFIEAILVKLLLGIFSVLPVSIASAVGGFLARKIGPFIKASRTARKNLNMVMPELDEQQVSATISGMWDNLGRVAAEFIHLKKMGVAQMDEIVEFEGIESVEELIKGSNKGFFIVSGHYGNWEIIVKVLNDKYNANLSLVYRKANNPYVEEMINEVRNSFAVDSFAKGPVGGRQIIKRIADGKPVAMLTDQKQNDGIAVPFFGIDAMTAPAVGNIALRYDVPIVPVRVLRKFGNRYVLKVYPRIEVQDTGDKSKDVLHIMTELNGLLELWIKESPSQWFWVHNRWPRLPK